MNKARVTIGPLLAGNLLLLAGCAISATGNTKTAGNSANSTTVENCGNNQTFDSAPERVVVQPHQSLELFAALGAADRVVGTAEFSSGIDSLDSEYQDRLADISVLGDGPLSQEVVVDRELDLFYSQINFDESMVEDYEPLGVPLLFTTLYFNEYAPQDDSGNPDLVQSRYDDIADLGRLFDVEDRAAELTDSLQEQISDVRAENDDESVDVAPIGFFSGVDGPLSARPSGNLVDQLIGVAGSTNVYGDLPGDGNSETGPESFIERNPDVIIIRDLPSNGRGYEEVKKFLRNDPRFRGIPAVKHDRFTYMKVEEWYAGIQFPNAAKRFADVFRDASTE